MRADSFREGDELRSLLGLAGPLMLANAANQLMGLVDTIMVGRLGAAALAGVGVGNGLFFAVTIFGVGIVLGMDAPVSQAVGALEPVRARRVLWQGVRIAIALGIGLSLLMLLAPLFIRLLGVVPAVAREANAYLLARIPNAIPLLLFTALRSYLQAHEIARPMVIATVLGNLFNVVGNALLIYGDEALLWIGLPGIGLPPLGVTGAALSSVACAFFMLGVLVIAVRAIDAPPDPFRRAWDRVIVATILRVGVPVAGQLVAEVGAFALAGVLCARLGELPGAAHQVAISLASFTFTVALGVSAATAVRVGGHIGRGDTPAARHAGFLGFATGGAFMTASGLAFILFPGELARLIAPQPAIVAAAVPLMFVAAVFQIFDGLQAVGAGALRGAGDTRVSLLANVIGYYAFGLPLGIVLAFPLGMGATGIWWGLSAGLIAVAAVLVARFAAISSRTIHRVT